MIKHFCDVCDNEITDGNHVSIQGDATLRSVTNRRYALGVTISISSVDDDPTPELCKPCAFAAVIQLSPERLVVADEVLA